MRQNNQAFRKSRSRAAIIAATTLGIWGAVTRAGISANTTGPVQQGQSNGGTGNPTLNNPAITISFSGQTALRNFNTSPGITLLQPGGGTITLHNGTNGAAVNYFAPAASGALVQLASSNFASADINPGTPASPSISSTQIASAIRFEWHEQGSVDGFYDLVNDQVGYAQNSSQAISGNPLGPISNSALRIPSASNPTWINTNKFVAGASSPVNGFLLDASAGDNLANTYDATVYTPATGVNIRGGQNRIQFSVGEFPTEAVSASGSANVFRSAGASGYGLGNPALNSATTLTGLGVKGTRQQYQPATVLNESSNIVDPQTGSNYTAGPWNTAGADNVTSTSVAVTAVTYSANPGTGLSRVNKSDAQWLQTTGRLQNGALFNVVARTVDTGQRIVFALNTGVDPSWAAGSNDDGNSTSTAAANAQHSIGSSLRFSGKTSGTEAEKTIASSRMAVGALSVPEVRAAASNAPVRALDVDFNDLVDPTTGGVTDASEFLRANFDTIVSSNSSTHYGAVLISHYNTIKAPSVNALNNALIAQGINPASATDAQKLAAWKTVQAFDPATAETDSTPASATISGIKGDPTGDVAAFIGNIVNSTGTAAAGLNVNSVNNPADNLFVNGFLIPGLLNYTRETDGGPITPVTLSPAAQSEQQSVNNNYGFFFTTDNTAGANSETTGVNAHYGDGNTGGGAINGAVAITAKDANGNAVSNGTVAPAGNYLFGNFNQNGVRDYSAVLQSVNAALSLHHVDGALNSIFTTDGGATNSTVIASLSGTPAWVATGTNTKGDLIALGDYNGDGKFDGYDVYLLAKGASLADSRTSTTLTATAATFANAVRNPNAVLRKNAALDAIDSQLTNSSNADQLFLRQTGRAVLTSAAVPGGATDLGTNTDGTHNFTFDPNGLNAFNKFDVNRDGKIDRTDAQVVDYFVGKDYHNLSDTLGAVVRTDLNAGGSAFVNSSGAPLDTASSANSAIPRRQISLVDVELNDNGTITDIASGAGSDGTGTSDFKLIRTALGSSLADGDTNFDGTVNTLDFVSLASNFNQSGDKWSQGDFNFDGVVNSLDFNALATNFGVLTPAPSLAALVPEPISLSMLLPLSLVGKRRRKL